MLYHKISNHRKIIFHLAYKCTGHYKWVFKRRMESRQSHKKNFKTKCGCTSRLWLATIISSQKLLSLSSISQTIYRHDFHSIEKHNSLLVSYVLKTARPPPIVSHGHGIPLNNLYWSMGICLVLHFQVHETLG